jgi:hypothetical protein
MDKVEELTALVKTLAKWLEPAGGFKAYLFGSRVRGDHRSDSDVRADFSYGLQAGCGRHSLVDRAERYLLRRGEAATPRPASYPSRDDGRCRSTHSGWREKSCDDGRPACRSLDSAEVNVIAAIERGTGVNTDAALCSSTRPISIVAQSRVSKWDR